MFMHLSLEVLYNVMHYMFSSIIATTVKMRYNALFVCFNAFYSLRM